MLEKLLFCYEYSLIICCCKYGCFNATSRHEDIKDAMLSLVHMMRENTEKLERHEARERQLGEHLKKALAVLTKRTSTIESFKTELAKLDEKVIGIEQLISQVSD
ncbi:hypothetical protein E2986_13825 [Frieseomelitta varia]|uniref:Uncharacterized protein n=1 Tax=Frieseomelitta varia TaxID=561572 RepID=A0A833RJW4_9HYME|nr:hypothetical protein E2986_13825 [Frieseomelitta varia]